MSWAGIECFCCDWCRLDHTVGIYYMAAAFYAVHAPTHARRTHDTRRMTHKHKQPCFVCLLALALRACWYFIRVPRRTRTEPRPLTNCRSPLQNFFTKNKQTSLLQFGRNGSSPAITATLQQHRVITHYRYNTMRGPSTGTYSRTYSNRRTQQAETNVASKRFQGKQKYIQHQQQY